MKKILALLICLAFCTNVYAQINVPAETEILLQPIETITSKRRKANIKLQIKEDVTINNTTIFKQGDKAVIKISDNVPAGFMGSAGTMDIYNGYVYDTKGNKHNILIDEQFIGKEQIWAQALFSIGLFTIILCPLCLFGFVKGTNAKLSPKNELNVILEKGFVY